VNDILDGHVRLDLESFDRIYLNGYVPNLQVGGQVVNFLTHRGFPIPSPALLEKNGTRSATPSRPTPKRTASRGCVSPGATASST
jgi:hypothetical protein